MTKRLKKISAGERAARAELKNMGVSEHDLRRFYDANYKAKQRAAALNRDTGESLNVNWKSILQGARQNVSKGTSATEYLKLKTERLKTRYKLSESAARESAVLLGTTTGEDWGAELVKKELSKMSASEIADDYVKVLDDMEKANEQMPEPTAETYARSHKRYIDENAATKEEWDRILKEELAKEMPENDTVLKYTFKRLTGYEIESIRRDQQQAEQDAQQIEESKRAAWLNRRKREIIKEYAPVAIK